LSLSADSDAALQLEEELDEAVEEVNQHDPDTALALAKAYIDLGEEDIARDFLQDVINTGSVELKSEAKEMLASLG
jgi:FimV-like protein